MKNPIKRLSLGISLLLVLVTISSTSEYTFASSNKPEISQEQANRIAAYYIDIYQKEQVPSWLNATINKSSTIYYSVNNQPVAYEISVLCDKNEYAGYIVVSARKDWTPVLEHSTGIAPSHYLDDVYNCAIEKGLVKNGEFDNPKIFYFGAFAYYTQFGDEMISNHQVIHLCTGYLMTMPDNQPTLSFNRETVRYEWQKFRDSLLVKNSVILTNFNKLFRLQPSTIVSISDQVPAWYQSTSWSIFCDEGGAVTTYPTCRGPADDFWINWDGCAPIAGAMVIGYWDTHGYPNFPISEDEDIIDDCHIYMFTDHDTGSTYNYMIREGIEDIASVNGYDFTCTLHGYPGWYLITDEIDANRPFVLSANFTNGWGLHAVTGVAYNTDPMEIGVHKTTDTSLSWVSYGAMSVPCLTRVIPGT